MRPRYVVYGGLLFQPLEPRLDRRLSSRPICALRHFFDFFVSEQIYLEHPEVIVLTNILPDPINTYLAPYRVGIVDEMNGKKIRTTGGSGQSSAETPDRFVINMIGDGPPLVLDPKQVEAARERIKTRYNVVAEQNLEEQDRPPSSADDQKQKLKMRTDLRFALILCSISAPRRGLARRKEPRHRARPP